MENKKSLITVAALLIIPLVYFYPVLLGQVVLAPGDGWAQNFAVRALAGQMIAGGDLPLWNPFIFAGMPLAASVYPGAFYPPNWLFAILSTEWAMNIVVLTTYHLALIGTYLYARRLGITRSGSLLASIAFTFGGFMINHLSHTSRIAAAAWLPWVLLAIENVASFASWRKAWRWVVLGALFIALQFFAGEPQMVIFTALVSAPFVVLAFWRCEGREDRVRFTFAISAMLICGALLSAVQLLPSLELLGQSERSDPGPAFFGTFSLPPWQLPGLIFPYFFGGAMLPPYRVPYWGEEIAAIMSGYVGMLAWMLALTALIGARRNVRVWLWLSIAIISIILALGGHLPYGLNDSLYRIPGYSTFRGLYRHQFEFTFAMAMLAGFGMSSLAHLNRRLARWALLFGTICMSAIVAMTAIFYRYSGQTLASVRPRPPIAASLANAEFIIPISCFALSLGVIWLSQIRNPQSAIRNLLLITVLLFDLASYGHFFHWRIVTFNVGERLADPPAVQLIKSRERDLNSFRVLSYPVQASDFMSAWPEDPNYELINQPNISILRGLQSAYGLDVLRPARVGEMTGSAGSMLHGFVQDLKSFSLADRGLDVLNVKYLIVGYGGATDKKVGFTFDGVYFAWTYFGTEFVPGVKLTTEPGGVMATEIAIVSTAVNTTHLPDGAPILKLRLHTREGHVIERELRAGRDTSEWNYDRADVRAAVKHHRAHVVESQKVDGFDKYSYLGRLKFDRTEIEKIDWIYAREDGVLYLTRASLHDETTGVSTPLSNFHLPPERWRELARFDQIEVYENLRVMPRAWFVDKRVELSPAAAIKTIRSGSMPNGDKFDPQKIAIIEKGILQEEMIPLAYAEGSVENQQVKLTSYGPHRIELETSRPEGGFLVLSEGYYDGWKAYLDGKEQLITRTDYTIRGIDVPPGDHRILFIYDPSSFRAGLALTVYGALVLALGAVIVRRRQKAED
ncbi:MAG: YfhO family protein [Acidobacteria bacterium]|nr:YfhO family protein [Acidobacteriota bacterium]